MKTPRLEASYVARHGLVISPAFISHSKNKREISLPCGDKPDLTKSANQCKKTSGTRKKLVVLGQNIKKLQLHTAVVQPGYAPFRPRRQSPAYGQRTQCG
jgi:hypothetical protein